MKRILMSVFLLFIAKGSLFGFEKNSAVQESKKQYFNVIIIGGLESYLDDFMRVTYNLPPVYGFEISTNVSPIFDGVIEVSFSHRSGTYQYQPPYWYDNFDSEVIEFNLFYRKLALGMRLCDRDENMRRVAFFESGLNVIYAKESYNGQSETGAAMGPYLAIGSWWKIRERWFLQGKVRAQLLAVPGATDLYNSDLYEIDFSGAAVIVGFGITL